MLIFSSRPFDQLQRFLLAVHAVQGTQTQGDKYCLCEGGCLVSFLLSQFQVYSSLTLTNQYLIV